MTPLLICLLVTFAVLMYVFYLPGVLHLGPRKTRLSYLQERKEAVYENLRDLNFEYKSGKFPPADYESMKSSLEDEAAAILAEMSHLQQRPILSRMQTAKPTNKGPRI